MIRHDEPEPTLGYLAHRRRMLELGQLCPHCGNPAPEGLVTVTYDTMVDGPGHEETEELCRSCLDTR